VIRPHLDFRGYAGQIASGVIRPGDAVRIQPAGTPARVKRIVSFDGDLDAAWAPMSITLELDREIDASRGDWIVAAASTPQRARRLKTTLVWMNDEPAREGAAYLLQHGTRVTPVRLARISERLDPATQTQVPASELRLNDIGLAELETADPLPFDLYRENRATGGFILIDRISNLTLAAGLIESSLEDEHEAGSLSATERSALFGHRPCLVDLSARPELAPALERLLLLRHAHAIVIEDAAIPADFLLAAGLLVISTTPRPEAAFTAAKLSGEPAGAISELMEVLRQAGVFGIDGDYVQGEGI
jgi:hypothetical protein